MMPKIYKVMAYVVFLLILSSHFVLAEMDEEKMLIKNYFNYLKNSNFSYIDSNLSGRPAKADEHQRKSSQKYRQYIKNLYKDSRIDIERIEALASDKRRVFIHIYFSNDTRPVKTSFLIGKTGKKWVVLEEVPYHE